MAGLFDTYTLKGTTLRNRIVVSPMCQYMATGEDGVATDWHRAHYAQLARGGAGLVIVEATAVAPEGRITWGDLGLWNDRQTEALRPIVRAIRDAGAVPGIQIAHAGRKASANRPWEGDDHIAAGAPHAWTPIAPSAVAFGGDLPRVPEAMTVDTIARVRRNTVETAVRARELGFEWLELHMAHGYLAQNFFSPYSNKRDDAYGGSPENRARYIHEVFGAVREVWPVERPLAARLGVVEFDDGGDAMTDEAVALLRRMKAGGLDFVDVSIGFNTPDASIPWAPNFMGPIASRIRHDTGLPVTTSWYISEPEAADRLVRDEVVDLISLGRPLLANPHWPYAAAQALRRADPAWVLPPPYAHWLSRYR